MRVVHERTWGGRLFQTHCHTNSDYQTTSPQLSAQPLLASAAVRHSPFGQCHLLTLSDDTWKLTCSSTTPPLTKCDHPCLQFEPFSSYSVLLMLLSLLTYLQAIQCQNWNIHCFANLTSTSYKHIKIYNTALLYALITYVTSLLVIFIPQCRHIQSVSTTASDCLERLVSEMTYYICVELDVKLTQTHSV